MRRLRSRRDAAVGSSLCLLVVALVGSCLSTFATDYEDIVVTYEDPLKDDEVYQFIECRDGKPYWELRVPFVGTMGRVVWAEGDPLDCCSYGWFNMFRLDCEPGDCPQLYAYLIAQSEQTRADDPSGLSWVVVPHPSGTPTGVSGGDFVSGTRCCNSSVNLAISGTPAATAFVGEAYSFTPTVSGGTCEISFSIQNRPDWATFDTATEELSGVPDCDDRGDYADIVITATDVNGPDDAADVSFSITVKDRTTITGCPDDIVTVVAKDGSRAVTWTEPSANNACGVTFTSNHSPGDAFPLGTTTVTYTAVGLDDGATCSFDVTMTLNSADINLDGVVDLLDVLLCLQIATGVIPGTPQQRTAADVDRDGDVDETDAEILSEYVLGIRTTLP